MPTRSLTPAQTLLAQDLLLERVITFTEGRVRQSQVPGGEAPFVCNLRMPSHPKTTILPTALVAAFAQEMLDIARSEILTKRERHIIGTLNAGDVFAEKLHQIAVERHKFPGTLLKLKADGASGRTILAPYPPTIRKDHSLLFVESCIGQNVSLLQRAIHLLRSSSATLLHTPVIVTCIDLEEGGVKALQDLNYRVLSVFTLRQLVHFYLEDELINEDQYRNVLEYLDRF